jgi:peptidoglycan/LPS O-acetylase OafA/YrhL
MADAATQVSDRVGADDFPCIDGLRAIAALSVAITHSGFISGFNVRSSGLGAYTARMDIGVAIFFVISGFLLYRPFVAARLADRPGPAILPFGRRRALRILPAYWVALTAVALIPSIQWHKDPANPVVVEPIDWIAHYGLFHTYHLRFGLIPVQQAWTLVTEIAFYAMLPLYALVLRRFAGTIAQRFRHELVGVAALFAAGLMFRTLVLFGVDHDGWRGTMNLWLLPRLDHFALGMALAVLSVWHRESGREPAWSRHVALPAVSWSLCAASFWFVSIGFGLDAHRGQVNFSLAQEWWLLFFWGIVGVTAIAPAVFGPQRSGSIRALLRWRPVAWLGTISYGIYLWHEAVLDWYLRRPGNVVFGTPVVETTLIMLLGSIVLAALSYYVVERPALSLKNRPVTQWLRRPAGAVNS